jgi:pimeloyl-ACP methyl ester carboxylesterase
MQQLGMKYRVYALDLWGFGDTEKDPQRYSFASQVKLLMDFMEKLGIGKAAIVGHALGAAVGITFARQFPERAPRVMLISPPLFDLGGITAAPTPAALPTPASPPTPISGTVTTPAPPSKPALPTPTSGSSAPAAAPATSAQPAPAVSAPVVAPSAAPAPTSPKPAAPLPASLPASANPALPAVSAPAATSAPAVTSTAAPTPAAPAPTASAPTVPAAGDTLARNPFLSDPQKLTELQQSAGAITLPKTPTQPAAPAGVRPSSSVPSPRPAGADPLSVPFARPETNPLVNLLSTINPKAVVERHLARDPENLEKMRAEVEKMDNGILQRLAPSFQGINLAQQLSQLASPVLLFHGREDAFFEPNEELINRIGALKADGLFLPFVTPEFRHFPMLEQTLKFNRLTTDFLDAPDLTNVQMKETWRRQLR